MILGNLNQPTSQIWESDFDRFMTTKHGNPIVRQQSNLSWTEQFLDGKGTISSKALKMFYPMILIFDTNLLCICSNDPLGQIEDIVQPLASEWVDEFSSLTVEEVEHQKAQENEATYKQDFWKNLESEWRKELEDSAQSAAWLDDFDAYVPYEKYDFAENNPLKDHENCLEEGKKKLAEGT